MALSGDRPSKALPDDIRFLSLNVCGNVCHGGGDGVAEAVAAVASRSDVVMLQEVCRSQAQAITDALRAAWSRAELNYVTTYADDAAGRNRCTDDDYGIAIITATAVDATKTIDLPNPGLGGRQFDRRLLLCVDTAVRSGAVTACTAHLVRASNDADAHRQQIAALPVALSSLARLGPVIFGGDLNEPASTFDAVASVRDWHRVRATSTSIDQAWASPAFARLAAQVVGCHCSDHRAIEAGAELSGT